MRCLGDAWAHRGTIPGHRAGFNPPDTSSRKPGRSCEAGRGPPYGVSITVARPWASGVAAWVMLKAYC